jgi:ribosomal protein L20A (L18A)
MERGTPTSPGVLPTWSRHARPLSPRRGTLGRFVAAGGVSGADSSTACPLLIFPTHGPALTEGLCNEPRCDADLGGAVPQFAVTGTFLARRDDWQTFTKRTEAPRPEQAREWALSEIGGCHHVPRTRIRITQVAEVSK